MGYGQKIKQLREAHRMYQHELGALLGVTPQAVSKWEMGKAEPDSDNLKKICEIFHVDANTLLGMESITDDPEENIRFALFGDPAADITDEEFEDIKRFAQFLREKRKHDK